MLGSSVLISIAFIKLFFFHGSREEEAQHSL
jgi:hypothetical protein